MKFDEMSIILPTFIQSVSDFMSERHSADATRGRRLGAAL